MEEFLARSEEEQQTLLKRLTHHALCKMRRLTWRGAYVTRGGSVPGGYEPDDFALDAIQKLFNGTRSWNRDIHPTLEGALRAIIDSEISHLVECMDNTHVRRLAARFPKDETSQAYEVPGTEPNPLVVVIDREWQQRFHDAAMRELDGDAFLQKLLECLEAEYTKPQEIAELLDTSVDEVNKGKKRLRRALEKLEVNFFSPQRKATS